MQQDDMLHLRELREAHTARLRVLEVQSAQLGVNCPAHVKVEIASIKEALYVIEQQVGGEFLFSKVARTNVPIRATALSLIWKPRLLLSSVILLILVVLLLSVYGRPIPAFIRDSWTRQPDNSPRLLSKASSSSGATADVDEPSIPPNINAVAISCGQDVVVIFLESGLIAWKNAELDRVSMSVMPPGSRLRIYCRISEIGEAEIILVRTLIIRGKDTQVAWIIVSYRCYGHKVPISGWQGNTP